MFEKVVISYVFYFKIRSMDTSPTFMLYLKIFIIYVEYRFSDVFDVKVISEKKKCAEYIL